MEENAKEIKFRSVNLSKLKMLLQRLKMLLQMLIMLD